MRTRKAGAMSKPVWWTCGCGQRNRSTGVGRPVCCACSKDAKFEREAPKEQQSLFQKVGK